jgi:hypothetical protein
MGRARTTAPKTRSGHKREPKEGRNMRIEEEDERARRKFSLQTGKKNNA